MDGTTTQWLKAGDTISTNGAVRVDILRVRGTEVNVRIVSENRFQITKKKNVDSERANE